MFSSIINAFSRAPIAALVLFYGFIPTFFLILTILFIMIHVGVICPTTILDFIFDGNDSSFYNIIANFIQAGAKFIGYFIDVMFKIIDVTFDTLFGDGNFFDDFLSGGNDCPVIDVPEQTLEN